MQYVWDDQENKYLDLFGGIVTISAGHCHPKVNAALHKQVDTIWHTTNLYYHSKIHEYAEKLLSKFPKDLGLDNVMFVNSGSEANDAALMMAKLYTGRTEILSFHNAYHGASPWTQGLTCHGNWKYNLPGMPAGHHYVPHADVFTGPFRGDDAKERYLEQFDRTLQFQIGKNRLAGLWAEPIQGVGGCTKYPEGFLKACFEKVQSEGGLCVADEVQTGFGRTGTHYWGFQSEDLRPDMVVMAKGIGNGFPMAAVVTKSEIAKTLGKSLTFNTFGGNPMACAVGSAVLDAIDEDGLQKNCHEVGKVFMEELEKLKNDFETVGEVRGKGLMLAIEFVKDKQSRKPLEATIVGELLEKCRQMGVLYGKGGINGNIFRIKPPMCMTKDNAIEAVKVLRSALQIKNLK